MLQITITMTNDQAEAVATILPEVLAHVMDQVTARNEEDEGPDGERVDDLTKTRAVLGDVQSKVVAHLDTIRRLDAEDRRQRLASRVARLRKGAV